MKNTQNNIQIRGTGTLAGTGTKTLRSRNSLGFTLVELIVVITILAILGALAFTQMGGFQGNARDSDRVTTLSQLDSGLELYQIKIGKYPMPEVNSSGVILTGSIDGTVYAHLGVIGDLISTNIRMNKTPVDPASGDKYIYATDSTQSHYQIAATLENAISYENSLIPQVHAATPAQARVNGNYPGYIKFMSGVNNTETWITNVPSLIWYATGASISLTANPTTTYFIVNKQNNLPYRFNTTDIIQNQNATQILQSVTGYSTATLILTGITSLTATGIEAQFGTSATLSPALASFGGDLTKLTTALLGTTATTGSQEETPTNSCATQPTYTHATFTVGTPTSVGQAWQNTNVSNPCYYVCTDGYTGADCNIPPPLITQADCTGAGWTWVTNTQDVYIGITQGNGFCLSPTLNFGDTTDGLGGISWNGYGDYNLAYYLGWNPSGLDDDGNTNRTYGQTRRLDDPTGYTCKTVGTGGATKGWRNAGGTDNVPGEDTLLNRMRYLANYKTTQTKIKHDQIDWIVFGTVPVNNHAIPALFLSDCLDGTKDLTTTMTYKHYDGSDQSVTYASYNTNVSAATDTANLADATYQTRQKYLLAWTQKVGSHLPSAYSYFTAGCAGPGTDDSSASCVNDLMSVDRMKGEYQMACEKVGGFTDQAEAEWIWLAAVGTTDGSGWGRNARVVGDNGCGDQSTNNSGNRLSNSSARFVVRP